jgi:hypothetical protein
MLRRLIPARLAWLPDALSPHPPRPPVDVELGPGVPAWALRATCVALAAGCTALVASHPAHWVIATGLVAGMLLQPGTGAGGVFAGGIGLLLLTGGSEFFDVRVPLLVLGLHLTLELVTLTAGLPWRTTIERSVVRAHLAPVLPIQALSQTVALVAPWLASTRPPAPLVAAVASAALAVIAWAMVLRLRTRT